MPSPLPRSTASPPPTVRCPACAASVVRLELRSPAGVVTLRSCSSCGHRSWERQGEVVERDAALSDLRQLVGRRLAS